MTSQNSELSKTVSSADVTCDIDIDGALYVTGIPGMPYPVKLTQRGPIPFNTVIGNTLPKAIAPIELIEITKLEQLNEADKELRKRFDFGQRLFDKIFTLNGHGWRYINCIDFEITMINFFRENTGDKVIAYACANTLTSVITNTFWRDQTSTPQIDADAFAYIFCQMFPSMCIDN